MSEPFEVVERLLETLNDHDLAAGRALYAQNARLVTATGQVVDLNGLDAILEHSFAAFPDLRIRLDRWATQDDTIFTEEVMTGTHDGPFAGLAPTGRQVQLPMVHITRVAAGRIVERVAFHDTAGILRQLS